MLLLRLLLYSVSISQSTNQPTNKPNACKDVVFQSLTNRTPAEEHFVAVCCVLCVVWFVCVAGCCCRWKRSKTLSGIFLLTWPFALLGLKFILTERMRRINQLCVVACTRGWCGLTTARAENTLCWFDFRSLLPRARFRFLRFFSPSSHSLSSCLNNWNFITRSSNLSQWHLNLKLHLLAPGKVPYQLLLSPRRVSNYPPSTWAKTKHPNSFGWELDLESTHCFIYLLEQSTMIMCDDDVFYLV